MKARKPHTDGSSVGRPLLEVVGMLQAKDFLVPQWPAPLSTGRSGPRRCLAVAATAAAGALRMMTAAVAVAKILCCRTACRRHFWRQSESVASVAPPLCVAMTAVDGSDVGGRPRWRWRSMPTLMATACVHTCCGGGKAGEGSCGGCGGGRWWGKGLPRCRLGGVPAWGGGLRWDCGRRLRRQQQLVRTSTTSSGVHVSGSRGGRGGRRRQWGGGKGRCNDLLPNPTPNT